MLTLYSRHNCAYCEDVLAFAEDAGVKFIIKDIGSDNSVLSELVAIGGKQQVPYLVDSEKKVQMYESQDIIAYLQTQYGEAISAQSFGGLRIHKSEDICDTCQ